LGVVDLNKLSGPEREFAEFLQLLAPRILPEDKSVVQGEIPGDVLNRLFEPSEKFSDRVELIKPYLKQPYRLALVKEAPTLDKPVVRYSPEHFQLIELLYIIRCIVAIFPRQAAFFSDIVRHILTIDVKDLKAGDIRALSERLTKLRGLNAPISAVASAATKIFYTVDGMAFDDFAISLTAVEWEIITHNMDRIRLAFADTIRKFATEEYNFTKSKKDKLRDKAELDKQILEARIPLVKILKLRIEDLHRNDQLTILQGLEPDASSKKLRYDRKEFLAVAKQRVLEQYRKEPLLDILKYVREHEILA
jgi:hypothetical protein